ncbi:MAG TPA: type VI secretion system ImpA family N-terminal domain-containing protein [Sphingopyxis sp.]|nr:type VI secretion system ImpA family N-terminal domain-containing protein [Sphingopyxis sp.]HMP45430.1 type VI secretion system ImpA family N-terminal domain-containing protein [Sphingopyxis sp.]
MKSLDELLAPVSDDDPAGSELDGRTDYEAVRTAFEINFAVDTAPADEGEDADLGRPPAADWRDIRSKIESESAHGKDMFLAASLARCGIALGDLQEVERGLLMLAGLLETYWDSVHPTLDALDYQGRKNICEQIAGRSAFAFPLCRMPMLDTGRTAFTGDQLMDCFAAGPSAPAYDALSQALKALDEDDKQRFSATLASMNAAIARVSAVMTEQAGDETPPDFSTVRDTIDSVKSAFDGLAGLSVGDDAAEDAGESAGDPAQEGRPAAGGAALSGAVQSRDDVLKALRAIEDYYARAEPGHPIKVVAARLRNWVKMDFMSILEDIAPGSVDDARNVLLVRTDD